jgi:hypothetical protein
MITGQCLCGAVRCRASEDPLASRTCWCRLCQYLGAGSATVNVCFRKDSVSIEGELQDFARVADSGNHMHRRFCPVSRRRSRNRGGSRCPSSSHAYRHPLLKLVVRKTLR